MNSRQTKGFLDWLSVSVALVANRRIFLVVPVVFDLISLVLWSGLSWVLLDEFQFPISAGDGLPARVEVIQALPTVDMIVRTGRPAVMGDPAPVVSLFVVATLATATARAYGMAGFVGWLDRVQLIRDADLNASTFHLLGRRFFSPMLGYTLLWAAFSFLRVPLATTPLSAILFSAAELVAGAALMFTPYAILRHAIYTLDAMAISVDFAWQHPRIVLGLALLSFLATATGSYVAQSAMGLLGGAGYLISILVWAPIGCLLSAFAYLIYLDYETED